MEVKIDKEMFQIRKVIQKASLVVGYIYAAEVVKYCIKVYLRIKCVLDKLK